MEKNAGCTARCDNSRDAVPAMFDRIAGRYDIANRLLSLRRDVAWRRQLVRHMPEQPGQWVADLATGTADVPLELARRPEGVSGVVGLDLSERMLAVGREKLKKKKPGLEIALVRGDAAQTGLRAGWFSTVIIAFGLRNMPDVAAVLRETVRLLNPDGRLLVLEFSMPDSRSIRILYLFYLRHILPLIGGFLTGDTRAYRYLNTSIEAFPHGKAFCDLLRANGFRRATAHPLTCGIATLYQGER